MDIVNQTRELGDPNVADQVDLTSARNQLHRTIASSGRRTRMPRMTWARGGVLAGAGALAVGALVVGAGVLAPNASAPASAAEVLDSAAAAVENPRADLTPAPGQYLKVSSQTDHLLVADSDPAASSGWAFGANRGSAKAAVVSRLLIDTFLPHDPFTEPSFQRSTSFFPSAFYGDEAAGKAAWEAENGSVDEAPEVTVSEHEAPAPADAPSGDTFRSLIGDYPSDPAAFRTWWQKSHEDKFDGGTTASLMGVLESEQAWTTAPADFRATLLRALALDDALTMTDEGDGLKTISTVGDTSKMALVIDTKRDVVTSVWSDSTVDFTVDPADGTWVPAGPATSSPFIPADVHDSITTFTYQVVDEVPAVTTPPSTGEAVG